MTNLMNVPAAEKVAQKNEEYRASLIPRIDYSDSDPGEGGVVVSAYTRWTPDIGGSPQEVTPTGLRIRRGRTEYAYGRPSGPLDWQGDEIVDMEAALWVEPGYRLYSDGKLHVATAMERGCTDFADLVAKFGPAEGRRIFCARFPFNHLTVKVAQ